MGKKSDRREARIAAAVARAEEARIQRENAEMDREREIAAKWRELPQEEKDRRLERAKAEARAYGELVAEFGPEVGGLMANILIDSRTRKPQRVYIKE